jgi:hypothetical protein
LNFGLRKKSTGFTSELLIVSEHFQVVFLAVFMHILAKS